jgi:hypothetical protein
VVGIHLHARPFASPLFANSEREVGQGKGLKEAASKIEAPLHLIVYHTKNMSDPCAICLEPFAGVKRSPVTCPKCTVACCKPCLKQFLLTIIDDPHCPNCRFGYTRGFLLESLPKNFFTGAWADHRRSVLWEREKAYLPEAQVHIERVKLGREMQKDIAPLYEQLTELNRQRETLREAISILTTNIHRLNQGLAIDDSSADAERGKFVRKCPHTDCKGFLSSQWKCGVCDNYCCRECLAVRGPDREGLHTCSEADLATAKLLAKDSKPCPKCGEYIQRTEGCANMFCTSCKTAFNWNTMKIQEGGYIDNPHYFEYAANNNMLRRNPGDNPCGPELAMLNTVQTLIDWSAARDVKRGPDEQILQGYVNGDNETDEYCQAHKVRHCLGDMLGRMTENYNSHNEAPDTQMMRVRYLMNEESAETIQRALMNMERKRERHRAIRQVIDTFVGAGCDIFRNYVQAASMKVTEQCPKLSQPMLQRRHWLSNPRSSRLAHSIWTEEWRIVWPQFEELRRFCNKAFSDITRHYTCSTPRISPDYAIFTFREIIYDDGTSASAAAE